MMAISLTIRKAGCCSSSQAHVLSDFCRIFSCWHTVTTQEAIFQGSWSAPNIWQSSCTWRWRPSNCLYLLKLLFLRRSGRIPWLLMYCPLKSSSDFPNSIKFLLDEFCQSNQSFPEICIVFIARVSINQNIVHNSFCTIMFEDYICHNFLKFL